MTEDNIYGYLLFLIIVLGITIAAFFYIIKYAVKEAIIEAHIEINKEK